MCTRVGPEVTVLLRGTVVDCRSALPEMEAALEKHRESHEQWAQPLRDTLPNSDQLTPLEPYEKKASDRLSRVKGVIVTFEADSMARIPADAKERPAAAWEDHSERREIFLQVGGSSCDQLPSSAEPTVIAQEEVCCDVIPPSEDSCLLELQPFKPAEASLLEQVR